ncbi:hypothetical protein Nepgr_024995 [Nepenthes gracilis]|uniref:Peptidase A1 domain-containing protein n=1 Tax=Nepenthes gracilis TaxID=150966 RepID=A0AAD3T5N7_NEPGR|nr:hypothetical protein Nepgr_024995 [Nepenthes gracilis]
MAPPFHCLLTIFPLLFLSSPTAASATASITIRLSPFPRAPSKDPYQIISHVAKSSLARAHHLKQPRNTSLPTLSAAKIPLYPRSYGGYSISFSFGTPPQTIPLVMDTGSSLIWVPCTSRYVCSNCTFSRIGRTEITTFKPKLSSSVKIIGCRNVRCGWLFGSDLQSRCQNCDLHSKNCSQACPTYVIQYGSGATLGLLLSDALDLPGKAFPDFAFGCSVISSRQPEGIAGFGRAPSSLPAQLKLKNFGYCLVSHRFDDTAKSSDLVLNAASGDGVSYTPFYKNPAVFPYSEYYYVSLRRITVGGRRVKVPYRYLVPGARGHGGTIVDSGSTFTFLERTIRDPVAREIETQMAGYKRAADVEELSGLQPCFYLSGQKVVRFPELVFQFKGGAKLELPLANYFSFVADSIVCMTVISDTGGSAAGPEVPAGPAIILGNYQQQNFYIEYDLENERFGFRKQQCV